MYKRYQVFVSSTFEDLQEERTKVIQVLLESDCIPVGMELFPASNEEQWSFIKDVINDCDYYLLIIAGRYGSTNGDGKSYTQMEYEYARKIGKPIIAFIHKNPDDIPNGKSEKTAKGKKGLKEFKSIVEGYLIKYWETPNELAAEVVISLHKLIKRFPSEGLVKSNSIVDEESVREIRRLQAENRKLQEQLNKISKHAPEGADNLEQGDDIITINFRCKRGNRKLDFTWNQLYAIVAPHLIKECDEFDIKNVIEEIISKQLEEKGEDDHLAFLSKESLGIILVQFKALGLIQISDQVHTAKDKNTYWKLTPYGDLVMTQLVAKRKE